MSRRYIRAKPGQIRVAFGKGGPHDAPDIQYAYGGQGASKPDCHMLSHAFEEAKLLNGKSLRAELIDRGFDITTFQFTIQQKSGER